MMLILLVFILAVYHLAHRGYRRYLEEESARVERELQERSLARIRDSVLLDRANKYM